ncbi:helix-turn-helix domain-containing protein [Vibrio pectenicida]|uniref:Helix-turn-helix domain-containing protein n=1 Tax=Vibrio pectenicida TaxID=62763 RepID=A0A7Y4EG35_9VIBR|nr:NadS family protein [Vibrio pectenicida]NOH73414.1 helix-turn-helix domain-containing protein [Vibrio pectenicida]
MTGRPRLISLEEAVDIQHGRKKPSKVTRYEVADVKAIREEVLKITQAELAATMDVSIDTIKSWESKRRNPSGLAAKVLATIQDDPKVYDALAAH